MKFPVAVFEYMKKVLITIVFSTVILLRGEAQTIQQDTVYITAQAYRDSVVIRWAPGSTHLWKVANKIGYKVERRKADERELTVISTGAVKPYTLREWKQRADTTNVQVTAAAQVLLGNVMMQPQQAVTFSQKLLTSEEEKNRLALALYCAEFSVQAANGLALRWVDKNVEKDTKYYYRVSLFTDVKNTKVIAGIAYKNTGDVYKPLPVTGIEAEGKDGTIEVRWNKAENDQHFSGYYIERSDDGKKFTRLKDVPFKTTEVEGFETQHVYRDKITVYKKDYFYRVQGITSFADPGQYSAIVKAHTRDLNAPAPPSMLNVRSLDDKRVKLIWTDNPVAPDHAGYYIGRGTSIHGPFEKINAKPLKTTVREYVDERPVPHKPNFYTIIAADKEGNENQSVVGMAVLNDYTPPAQPTGLTGHVDTLGIVSLAWKLGDEEDLMGYRVYRSNHPDQEFIQITREPVPGNFYMDTIPLNALTKKVYYKVAAFDFNYNPSEYSAVLELRRPDYVPPVKPVIKSYTVKGDTIEIQWAPSSSIDVAKHILYRREADGEWLVLAEWRDKTNVYKDIPVSSRTSYSYALEAIDNAGLSSGKTRPLNVVSGQQQTPPVKNFRGLFDKDSKALKLIWEYDQQGSFKFVVYRAHEDEPLDVYGAVPGEVRTFTDNKFYRSEKGYSYAVKVLYTDGSESALSEKVTVLFNK